MGTKINNLSPEELGKIGRLQINANEMHDILQEFVKIRLRETMQNQAMRLPLGPLDMLCLKTARLLMVIEQGERE